MIVGLTYDLRDDYRAEGFGDLETAEFDRADTIAHIENAIRALGHATDRIGHARALVRRLAQGDRWDLVFNIAEGMHGFGREALVPALLEAYRIPYVFSDPLVCAVTLHKATAKRVLRDAGLPTPRFALVESAADIDRVDLPYPLFAKPVAEGTSKGVTSESRIRSPDQLDRLCRHLLEEYRQPVLVETFLPGREVTVGLIGTGERARVAGVLEVLFLETAEPDVYTYLNKEECETRIEYRLASGRFAAEAAELALRAWRALGCRDGGRVDLRADPEGRLSVIEANPLPGLHPEHSDLPILCMQAGIPYARLIGEIVASAEERVGPR